MPADHNWMEITPRGIVHSKASFPQRIRTLRAQASAIMFLVRHNLRQNTVGTVLGDLWMVLDPLLQAALYYFLIVILFGVKGNDVVFVRIMVAVTFWRLHSQMLEGACTLLASRADVIRQSGAPLSVIFFEFVGTKLGFFLFSLLTLFFVLVLSGIAPCFSWLWLFPVMIAQILFSLSLAVVLMAVCVVVRDLTQFVSVLVSIWWYMSPGLYDLTRIPARYRPIFDLNPFAYILPAYQDIFSVGKEPNLMVLAIVSVCSIAFVLYFLNYLTRVQHTFNRYL